MRLFFLFTLLTITNMVFAQDYTILGKLIDDTTGKPLESATVFAEALKDSTLLGYTITNRKGEFELDIQTKAKKVNVFISFTGLQTIQKTIDLDKPTVILGSLFMQEQPESLDEVVVVAERAPITIKKDTLEFNVASFKTKQGASVEDLLKKLPGVEVDENGKITVNGKEVSQVLVNGKPFFGNDPTIATKNIPKDIVDKIQVVDTKTKTEEFTGEKGDQKTKTINITIDEEKNKGTFGRITAGAGTDDRYKVSGILNYFNKDLRISILGGKNNVNTPGFSFNEIRDMVGGGRSISWNSNGSFSIDGRSFGGQRGITTSSTLGGYFTNQLSEKNSMTMDYFTSNSVSNDKTITRRENYIPDNNYILDKTENYKGDILSHAVNLNFETEIDSTFKIIVKPSLNYAKGKSTTTNQAASTTFLNELINSSSASVIRESVNHTFENSFEMVKKLGSSGSYVEFTMDNQIRKNTADELQQSLNTIFGDNPEEINRDQQISQNNSERSLNTNFRYKYPIIADSLFINVSYQYRNDKEKYSTTTFDYNQSTQGYSLFNAAQSTDFVFDNIRQNPQIGLNYVAKKFSLTVSGGTVFRTLKVQDYLHDIQTKKTFTNLNLSAWGNVTLSNNRSIYFNYSLDNSPPQANQLQPFTDTSDPLFLISGNPDLKPTQTHQWYSGYNAYDFKSKSGVFIYLNASFREDEIVSKTEVDENLVRHVTYANVNGGFQIGNSIHINKQIKTDSTYTLKIRGGFWQSYRKTINFTNDVLYNNKVYSITPNLGFTLNFSELVEIEPRYSLSITNSQFSLDNFDTQNFISHRVRLKTATFFPKMVEWRNEVSYTYNPNVASGFEKQFVIWNMSLGVKMFKDRGLFKAQVFDLLQQRNNIRRTATQDYVQDVQSTVLQQYFMFSFTYNLKKVGGKKPSLGEILILD